MRDPEAVVSSARGAARASGERGLEGGRGHLLDGQAEYVAVGAEALEGPGLVRLDGDADGATGRDDTEQDASAVRARGAAGE